MSFFEEDDDPRPRRQVRPPRSRGGVATTPDPQTIRIRQAILVAGLVLLLFLVFVGFRSCASSRAKDALRDYNQSVSSVVEASDQEVGAPFFDLLRQGGGSAQDLETQVNGFRDAAEDQLDRAEGLEVPDSVVPAQRSLLEVLELRRDGLEGVAAELRSAFSQDADVRDKAINAMAGQMRQFDAADVLYTVRVAPFIRRALAEEEIGGVRPVATRFLPGIEWLQPTFVAERLDLPLRQGGTGRSDDPPAPGLHGTGLVSVAAGDTTLEAGSSVARIPASDATLTVTVANQGENDEQAVEVEVAVETDGNDPQSYTGTIDSIAQGEQATAEVTIDDPPVGQSVRLTVEAKPVPGEEKTDNNKETYSAIFTE